MFRQIVYVDEVVQGHQGRARDYIFELSNISGPAVLQKDDLSPAGETLDLLAVGGVVFLDEKRDQRGNILQSAA